MPFFVAGNQFYATITPTKKTVVASGVKKGMSKGEKPYPWRQLQRVE